MVKQVVKRSGKTEPFIREKIVVSCLKSGAPLELARSIATLIEADPAETVESETIRTRVLELLAKEDAAYRDLWLMYDRSVKHRDE